MLTQQREHVLKGPAFGVVHDQHQSPLVDSHLLVTSTEHVTGL